MSGAILIIASSNMSFHTNLHSTCRIDFSISCEGAVTAAAAAAAAAAALYALVK